MTRSSGATIQSVAVRAVRVPMAEPHRTASDVITESPLVLVDLQTSDGVVGHGLAFTYTTSALKPLADFIANIAPRIVGDRLAPADIAFVARAAAIAEARGLRVSSHLWPEISAQLLCATPTAHWLEYADWWNPILASPLAIDHGFTRIDELEGSGVAWNEDAIARVLA